MGTCEDLDIHKVSLSLFGQRASNAISLALVSLCSHVGLNTAPLPPLSLPLSLSFPSDLSDAFALETVVLPVGLPSLFFGRQPS